jgi:hypothetical protein
MKVCQSCVIQLTLPTKPKSTEYAGILPVPPRGLSKEEFIFVNASIFGY